MDAFQFVIFRWKISDNLTDGQFKETMRYLKSDYGVTVSYRVAH